MHVRLRVCTLAILVAATIGAPAARAATTNVPESESSNWSGYVAGSSPGERFASLSASWVQPSVTVSARSSFSVFWVGLGGANGRSNALEQVGTEASFERGSIEYFAWYELVPSGPVKLPLRIRPGDTIAASVSVGGTAVHIAIVDRTTGRWLERLLPMSHPDTSSAEWIAEAPSSCDGHDHCRTLSLADFDRITFTDARATSTGRSIGSISDAGWSTQAVRMGGTVRAPTGIGPAFVTAQLEAGADPSSLSPDGSAFSVAYRPSGAVSGPNRR